MNRRRFFSLSAAALAVPGTTHAFVDLQYAPQTWSELRQTDETVVLFFRAEWSLTCQIKQDIITNLVADTPAFGQITFMDVDWDTFGRSQMTERLKVKRRSTLVVMKRGQEIARLENEPRPDKLKALLETALAA